MSQANRYPPTEQQLYEAYMQREDERWEGLDFSTRRVVLAPPIEVTIDVSSLYATVQNGWDPGEIADREEHSREEAA